MKLLNMTTLMVLLLVLMTSSYLEAADMSPAPAPTAATGSGLCDTKCIVRCFKASRHSRCLKYCGICCDKCNYCVPSGTYGNEDECPCYRDMVVIKTGKPKCP